MGKMTIGELAKAVGLNPPTIRYYEEVGLIPPPRRSESGYRLYSEEDVRRLKLVRRAKMLALSLSEIKEVVGYAVDGRCGTLHNELLTLLQKKLAETERQIAELARFREELSQFCDDLSARLACGQQQVVPSAEACRCLEQEPEITCR